MNEQFSAEQLKDMRNRFHYNSETGEIFRITDNKMERADIEDGRGYHKVFLRSKTFCILSHRFAWFLYYGSLPMCEIDHIDRDKKNNRIDNLRLITRSGNLMNMGKINNGSKSLYRGVTWNKSRQYWQAFIYKDGNHIYIGQFHDEKEAALAYIIKAKELYPDFFPADYHFDLLANS